MNKNKPEISSKPKQSINYLFYALGAAIPSIMGLYWPSYLLHPFTTPTVTRPAVIVIATITGLLLAGLRISKAEARLTGLLGLVSLIYLCTAFASVNVERSIQGWIKYLGFFLIAILLSRGLRNAAFVKGFSHALAAASFLIGTFILVTYVKVMGWNIPTFDAARRYKGIALIHGLPLNAIASTAIITFMLAMCLLRANKYLWAAGAILLSVCTIFTGSRAQVGVLVLAGFILVIFNGLRSARLGIRFTAYLVLAATLVSVPIICEKVSNQTMSDVTEGRWDLWYVAVQKFCDRPIVGYGYDSTSDDLFARLPGWYVGSVRLAHLYQGGVFPGGYHNLFLSVLVEQGLIGFVALLVLLWFVMNSSWQLAFRKWGTWHNGQWALAAELFLLLGGTVEVSGLLAKGSAPSDYLSYIFLALVVSRFSIEEQCARALLAEQRAKNSNAMGHRRSASHMPCPLLPIHEPQI